jgi:hypothetical protein
LRRKLLLLNLLLLGLLGAAGWELRQRWLESREREKGLLAQQVPAAPSPTIPQIQPVSPVPAANYLEVAQNMVFSKERNPNVVVEEKPPEPVPAFPIVYGTFDLGAGPSVFMSDKAGAPQKTYRVGDSVGPFRITDLSRTGITLEWKDKKFEKTLAELKPKPTEQEKAQQTVAAAPAPAVEAPKVQGITSDEGLKEVQKEMSKDGLPGVNVGAQARMCAPGDTAPAGTVQGGFRKVMSATPFGQSCRWEPVR